ncbi:MAG: thioredoxin-dependent thiol peroxidase [Actinomycetota bacterium]
MTRLAPGDRAPAFTLTSSTGSRVSLKDFHGRTVVLYCYPAAMTPGCTLQAVDFQDNLAAFTDASIIGISPDPPAKLAQFAAAETLSFTLLSDPDHRVMEKFGAWGEKKLYGKTVTGVIRSTFVVSTTGRIERAFYNVKATGHVAKLIRDLGLT